MKWREYRKKRFGEIEADYVFSLMRMAKGDMGRAQEVSGLSRARLYALLKKHGYPRREWKRHG